MGNKVIITDHCFPSIDIQEKVIKDAGFELESIQPICKTEDDIINTCKDADVLLVQWAPVTRRVLEALPNVKCIVRYGVGVNNFDLEAAKDLGVMACNVPNFCLDEVSDHAVTLAMALVRRVIHNHNQIMKGGWDISDFRPMPAPCQMKVGLVSFGNIAQKAAKKFQAFGFEVMAYDPFLPQELFDKYNVKNVDFDTLCAESDVISLHCPLVPATTGIINKDSIAKMKDRVVIVNTSRGPVVKEADLIEALQSGKVVGAGLDVFEVEPLPADSPLLKMDNVILTGHAASVSENAVYLLQRNAAMAAVEFLQGKVPSAALPAFRK